LLQFRNAGGRCAFPNCNKPILDQNNRLKGEICHIEAAMPKGERFNLKMTNEERRSYENLILLCFDHHEETNNEDLYTVGVLQEMKKAHEENVSTSLTLIGSLAEVSITEDVPKVDVNAERIKRAMELLKRQEQFLELERTDYIEPPNYIKRSVYSLRDSTDQVLERKRYDLIELVKSKRKITILGVAGSGKSVELDHLAFHYSKNNEEFFPIKIRLNGFNRNDGIEQLLEFEFKDYKSFKDQKLLVILDALDEVAPENLHEAVRQIEVLHNKIPNSTIIVSCRNNFYSAENRNQSSRIDGFETYALSSLTNLDIEEYCSKELAEKKTDFFQEVYKKKINDQLKTPFYLVNLVNFYRENGKLPKSRSEIFEFLLAWRIRVDNEEKYQNHGLYLEEHQEVIKQKIQRLAIAAESLQRSYLEDSEFRKVVPDPNSQILIKHTFLFDKNRNGSWEFHHNNFQEYLAAKYLTNSSIARIRKFISFSPDYKKVKPSWVNTVTLLFGLLSSQKRKFKSLLKWLISNEIDLVVRFEKENIDLKTRETIFKKIYQDFEKKKILIRSEKFDIYELGEFISDSHNIAKFLIRTVGKLDEVWKKAEALRILPNLEVVESYKSEIEALILSLINDENIKDDFKLSFLYTLRDLNIFSDELTKKLLEGIDLESSQYLRAGFYAYLSNAENVDQYSNIILDGIKLISEPKVYVNATDDDPKDTRLSDEKYNLEKLIEQFQSVKLTKDLLKWGQSIDEYRYDRFHLEIVEKALNNASVITAENLEIYDAVLALLISLARRYSRELSKDFNEYFTKTDTSLKAFKELRKKSKDLENTSDVDYYYAISAVLDKACIDELLEEYKKGELSNDLAFRFRNVLGGNSRDLHDYYLEEINKLSDNAFAYSQRDFEQERKVKLNNDVSLLLQKEKFKEELIAIFDKAKVDSFTWDELWEFSKEYLNDDFTNNNIVLTTLRQEARNTKEVSRATINNFMDDEKDWYWFQIHKILEVDKNNEDFDFDDESKEFLRNWLEEAIQKADFKTAVYLNEFEEIRYRYLEHYIPYISWRIDYELDEDIYLEFLWLVPRTIPQKTKSNPNRNLLLDDPNEEVELIPANINEYVIANSSVDSANKKIVENIASETLIDFSQKYNHCKFCAKYGLQEGVELIKELIQIENHNYEKSYLIEWYLNLSNDFSFVEDQIDSFEDEVRYRALELLLQVNSAVAKDYCIKKAKAIADLERKFRYINILSNSDPKSAFHIYKSWILKNKRLPDHFFNRNSPKSESIDDYFEIFEDAMNNGYGKGSLNNRNQFIDILISLGTKDEASFKKVRKRFESWIKDYDLKFLFYQIQRLELEYYSNVSENLSIDKIIEMLNKEEEDTISILNGLFELKPNIAGIGINLNRLVEYFKR
jgi:hypothetical protein